MDDGDPPVLALTPPVGPAMAALLLGVAHVRRHHRGATLEPMVALNVLRELDVLLAHAIEEAAQVAGLPRPRRRSSTRAKLRLLPSYAADADEQAAHAAIDSVRAGLMRGQRSASSAGSPARRVGLADDLAAGAALTAGIASKLGGLAPCGR